MQRAITEETLEKLLHVAGSKSSSNQFAIPIVCEFICFSQANFRHPLPIFETLSSLIANSCWRNLALESLVSWCAKEPELVQSYLLTNPDGIIEIFSNRNPRLETESQSISQLTRLCYFSKSIFTVLISKGFLQYQLRVSAIADAKLALDILRNIQLLLKSNFQILKKHYNEIRLTLNTLKHQKSAVVLGQIASVELTFNKFLNL
jgi:hypothetical protein